MSQRLSVLGACLSEKSKDRKSPPPVTRPVLVGVGALVEPSTSRHTVDMGSSVQWFSSSLDSERAFSRPSCARNRSRAAFALRALIGIRAAAAAQPHLDACTWSFADASIRLGSFCSSGKILVEAVSVPLRSHGLFLALPGGGDRQFQEYLEPQFLWEYSPSLGPLS